MGPPPVAGYRGLSQAPPRRLKGRKLRESTLAAAAQKPGTRTPYSAATMVLLRGVVRNFGGNYSRIVEINCLPLSQHGLSAGSSSLSWPVKRPMSSISAHVPGGA